MTGTAQLPITAPVRSGHQPHTDIDTVPAASSEHQLSGTAPDGARTPRPAAVHAAARIRAGHNGRTTTVPLLHSDGPFHLGRLRPRGKRARVCVIGAMSGPLGGDRLTLDVTAPVS